ncbi:dipeptidyl peptidase 1-like [Saccoglossus kowalevskii]|uniref:dipeptidyl-peptidase I n=1 Tax=Saccoglossus kowalevskii TaxID=10224 RepID=A0ABM0ML14_SACKO|nr:PREDICTED: dipeptidyl peptidase 1-like [Saccoglossus kowalevskii]
MASITKYFLICVFILPLVYGDTPGNCTYDSILGSWEFSIGETGHDNSVNCTGFTAPVLQKLTIELYFPDVAFDNYGNKGVWILVYNQGFEVVLNNRKYFAFSKYVKSGENYTSVCSETLPGWSHNIDGNDWACYYGKKINTKDRLQTVQVKYTFQPPKPAPITSQSAQIAANLPAEFDWRNVGGVNYVTPVRNQASCGSCFAFASAGMYESRLKVMTANEVNITISPQDVVQCCNYSQGCSGGFPYLVSKYSEDFGFVEETCLPYTAQDGPCVSEIKCKRHYGTKYRYVGDFYGGCNEALMKIELVKNGPMAVAFMVYDDFMSYQGGIYHHTGLQDKFNPFEITNHAVLLVGYGYDHDTKEKFWIVKNSWGTGWGEEGYFRIRRGNDECSIESIAVESTPIL